MAKPRIISGSARGRSLDIPARGTRPSPARLREALFNILAFDDKTTFLDLYSGSGAIGLEAASRGWHVTCIELSRAAAQVLQRNAKNLDLFSATVLQKDALRYVEQHPQAFDIVFAAPPYPLDLQEIFSHIMTSQVATRRYIFQHPSDIDVVPHGTISHYERRVYGSNTLTFLDVPQVDL